VTGDGHHRGRWVFLAQPLDQLQLSLRMQRDLDHHHAAALEADAVDALEGDGHHGHAEPAGDGLHPRRKEQVILDDEYRHRTADGSLPPQIGYNPGQQIWVEDAGLAREASEIQRGKGGRS